MSALRPKEAISRYMILLMAFLHVPWPWEVDLLTAVESFCAEEPVEAPREQNVAGQPRAHFEPAQAL